MTRSRLRWRTGTARRTSLGVATFSCTPSRVRARDVSHRNTKAGERSLPGLPGFEGYHPDFLGERDTWAMVKVLERLRAMSPTQPAPAAVGVDPVLLHEEVLRADLPVRSRAVRRCVGRAEVPRALVGVLVARIVVPGIEVFVGVGLFSLVRQGVDLGVGRGVVVGRARQGVAVEEI